LILEKVMHEIAKAEGLDDDPKPSQYFDLIGGTSTGG
jgi:patatin-like phospholipase/acyl hydrolase